MEEKNEKERARNSPYILRIKANRYFGGNLARIIIEIIEEDLPLTLNGTNLYRGDSTLSTSVYDYGEKGRDFYNNLKPKFGKITVDFKNGSQEAFNNLDDFIEKIFT